MNIIPVDTYVDELIRGDCKVSLDELGEGLSGDYDHYIDLLRFTAYKRIDGEWEEVSDCSYSTRVPVSATPEQRRKMLKLLMDELWHGGLPLYPDCSVKKLAERLSWVSIESIENGVIKWE